MPHDRARERETYKPEKTSRQIRPQELKRYPERHEYKEISQSRKMEAQFNDKTRPEGKRVLGLPRVEGFEKSGVMSNQEVKDYLRNEFPEKHANNITMEKVRYNDKFIVNSEKVELGHWEKKEILPNSGIQNREVVINRQAMQGIVDREKMKDSICHEIGHQVNNIYLEKNNQEAWLKTSGDRPKEKCVSEYATKNPHEDFAESYKSYIRNPEALKNKNAEKYNFMRDRVFSGREYVVEAKEEK